MLSDPVTMNDEGAVRNDLLYALAADLGEAATQRARSTNGSE